MFAQYELDTNPCCSLIAASVQPKATVSSRSGIWRKPAANIWWEAGRFHSGEGRKYCFFLPPFIDRWNALQVRISVVNGHPVLSFQPPFICKTSFGFNFFYNAFIYSRGGPMCPPNGLKWTVLRQTHGSAPTENGSLKRWDTRELLKANCEGTRKARLKGGWGDVLSFLTDWLCECFN